MKKRSFAILLSALFCWQEQASADAYGSGWYGEIQTMLLHEDNVSRSYKSEDDDSDLIASVSLGGGLSRKVGNRMQVVLSGYLTWQDHQNFSALDNLATSLGFDVSYQPGTGYDSPWFRIASSLTWLDYRDSEAREGALANIDFSINRRLSPETVGRLGYRYLDLLHLNLASDPADDFAAFDTAGHEIYGGLDHQLGRGVFVFLEYGYRRGGMTSTVSGALGIDDDYEAQTEDLVFDECDPQCVHRYAYRVVSRMHRLDTGIVFPLGEASIDLSLAYFDAEAESGGKRYKDWTVRLGAVWNF